MLLLVFVLIASGINLSQLCFIISLYSVLKSPFTTEQAINGCLFVVFSQLTTTKGKVTLY